MFKLLLYCQALLLFWYTCVVDCPENVELILASPHVVPTPFISVFRIRDPLIPDLDPAFRLNINPDSNPGF
jgi:hypothetical protein